MNQKTYPGEILLVVIMMAISGCASKKILSPEGVIDQHENLLGKTISIRGIAGTLWMSCTEEGCDPGRPCCNFCVGSLAIYNEIETWDQAPAQGPYAYQGNGPAIGLEFSEGGGCKGNECEVACEPLQLGKLYTINGLLLECSRIIPWCTMQVDSIDREGTQQ